MTSACEADSTVAMSPDSQQWGSASVLRPKENNDALESLLSAAWPAPSFAGGTCGRFLWESLRCIQWCSGWWLWITAG